MRSSRTCTIAWQRWEWAELLDGSRSWTVPVLQGGKDFCSCVSALDWWTQALASTCRQLRALDFLLQVIQLTQDLLRDARDQQAASATTTQGWNPCLATSLHGLPLPLTGR